MITFSQTLHIYEVLVRHFGNKEDALSVVQNIESMVHDHLRSSEEKWATKEDFAELKSELKRECVTKADLMDLKMELKGDVAQLEIRMEKGFRDQLRWIIVLMVSISGAILTAAKFL